MKPLHNWFNLNDQRDCGISGPDEFSSAIALAYEQWRSINVYCCDGNRDSEILKQATRMVTGLRISTAFILT